MKIEAGKYYTVIHGDHVGITGVADAYLCDDQARLLESKDPRASGVAVGLSDLREATPDEIAVYLALHGGGGKP